MFSDIIGHLLVKHSSEYHNRTAKRFRSVVCTVIRSVFDIPGRYIGRDLLADLFPEETDG